MIGIERPVMLAVLATDRGLGVLGELPLPKVKPAVPVGSSDGATSAEVNAVQEEPSVE